MYCIEERTRKDDNSPSRTRTRRVNRVDGVFSARRRGAACQTVEDRRDLLARDVLLRGERLRIHAGHDVVAVRPEDRAVVIVGRLDVGERVGYAAHGRLAGQPIQHQDEVAAGHVGLRREGVGILAGDDAVGCEEVDGVRRPVAGVGGRHVGEVAGGRLLVDRERDRAAASMGPCSRCLRKWLSNVETRFS